MSNDDSAATREELMKKLSTNPRFVRAPASGRGRMDERRELVTRRSSHVAIQR